ncbi:ester cyclase [Streptomyces sp. S1A1-7]|nr:ester cyclase [Streptomyces sp. S1A1-7]
MERFTSEFLPTGDPALARKFIVPDIVMHFGGRTQQGRDTYLGIVAANMKAFPDLRWTVEDMRAEGDTVAIRYTMTGTHMGPFAGVEATGRAIRAESMAFYRLAHGKIVEERAQLDMLSILQQMGAIPAA